VTRAIVNSEFVIKKKMLPRGEARNRTTAPIVSIPGKSSPMASPGPLFPGGRLKPILRDVVVEDLYCVTSLVSRLKLLEGSVALLLPPIW